MKKDKTFNLGNILFYLAYFLYITFYVLTKQSELSSVIYLSKLNNIIEIIVLVLLSIKILFIDDISFKKSILYLFLIYVFFKNCMLVDYKIPLFTMFFIISAQNINFKDFLKKDIILKLTLMLLIILLCITQVIPNVIQIVGTTFKQSLGFKYANYFSIYFISLMIEIICINKGIKNKYSYIIIILCLSFIFFITRSRTALMIFIFIFIIYLLLKNNKQILKNNYLRLFITIFPLIIFIINILLIILYSKESSIGHILNNFLTGRIKCAYEFLGDYDLTLFGQPLRLVSTRTAKLYGISAKVLDMAFIHVILRNGLIIFITFILTLIINQYYILKNKNLELLMANTFFIITALAETYIYNLSINFILIGTLYFINNKKKE